MNITVNAEEHCPWCGNRISHEKFLEVNRKIRAAEAKKMDAERERLEQRFNERLQEQAAIIEQTAVKEATKEIRKITAESEKQRAKLKLLEKRSSAERTMLVERAKVKQQLELSKQERKLRVENEKAVRQQQAERRRAELKLEQKLKAVERQLQHRTAEELGENPEMDLLENLRQAFPADDIQPVKKGTKGSDVIFNVLVKGETCGKIIIESKNTQAWQRAFVTKIRKDLSDQNAAHAVISTNAFPRGKKELCIESGVIVASPHRVLEIVELLRIFMVKIHKLGAGLSAREAKTTKLYKYIISQDYAQRFGEAKRLTEEIVGIETQEKSAHERVWQKRDGVVRQLRRALTEVETEISSIVESVR